MTSAVLLDIDLAISAYHDTIENQKREAVSSVIATFGKALDQLKKGDLRETL